MSNQGTAAAATLTLQAIGPFWDDVLQSAPVLLVLANTPDWEAALRTRFCLQEPAARWLC